MGNYSHLYATRNGASTCRIHWDRCQLKSWLSLFPLSINPPPPQTLEELGRRLDDHKVIGYLDEGYISDLRELSLHGLVCEGEHCFPRLYFDHEGDDDLYYLEFHPGTDVVILAWYPNRHEGFPTYPEDTTKESLYEQQYQEAMKRLHDESLDNAMGWRTQQLKQEDVDAPGSAVDLMCLIQGINPKDRQVYLDSLPSDKSAQLIKMRASELTGYKI